MQLEIFRKAYKRLAMSSLLIKISKIMKYQIKNAIAMIDMTLQNIMIGTF
jgi:hypothetical protein